MTVSWSDLRVYLMLAPDWPAKGLAPGGMTAFAPDGLGLVAPLIIRPYGRMADPDFYGWHERVFDPFGGAPRNDAQGGILYFDLYAKRDALFIALQLMGVSIDAPVADFVAFEAEATDPPEQRFLRQIRLMPRKALTMVFGGDEPPVRAAPEAQIKDAVAAFMEAESSYWHETSSLSGTLNGDGDWAKESLAFGFLVENTSWRIYRLWSRPYLVTK